MLNFRPNIYKTTDKKFTVDTLSDELVLHVDEDDCENSEDLELPPKKADRTGSYSRQNAQEVHGNTH